ncbi:MAG: SWIM zinc finger family protein, partial [Candidatus Poribacteria bacterium]
DVSGNYGDYSIEIYSKDGKIGADCDCPYEGYPCKHIVAVMLEFVEKKSEQLKKTEKSKTQDSNLKSRMTELSKEQLLDIILDCAKKYPDFKNELMVRFDQDKQKVLEAILKQIDKAFPRIEESYSMSQISKRLKTIAKQVDNAPDDLKADVYWAIADRTLEEINEYGIDDDTLENVAIDYMESLVSLLKGKSALIQKKQKIIGELMEYYDWGNCGITDSIYDTVDELLEEKSDYQIVINYLEKPAKSSYSGHRKELLADLYERIGDNEASLKILENNLHYGMDYWRLAEYWIDRKKNDKALEIVKEGLEKGEGRKDELYLYMQKYHEKHKDYDTLLALFKSKIKEYKSGFYNMG